MIIFWSFVEKTLLDQWPKSQPSYLELKAEGKEWNSSLLSPKTTPSSSLSVLEYLHSVSVNALDE